MLRSCKTISKHLNENEDNSKNENKMWKGSVIASSLTNLSADRSSSGSAGGSSISMVSVLELMTKTNKIIK